MPPFTNPFSAAYNGNLDADLVRKSVLGDRQALNELVGRHNDFIHNIAIKMLGKAGADDATQDILIRLITNLSSYDPAKAQFRTWLYRMSFNFLLNYKKSASEQAIQNFGQFFDFIEEIEDNSAGPGEEDFSRYSHETKMKCMGGMLLCLSREERLLFVVGDLFEIGHKLGAEIFETTPANFRKKLSRIRKQLYQWMDNKCGLVNKSNPCRCAKKTKGFIERGIVNPDNLLWNQDHKARIEDFTVRRFDDTLRSQDAVYRELYQEHPFVKTKEADAVLAAILGNEDIKDFLDQ